MSSKQDKIKQMLEMQKKFIALEQSGQVTSEAYWVPESGAHLDGFKDEYAKLANEVIDAAHEEKGSHR